MKVWLGGVMAEAQMMTDALPPGETRAPLIPLLTLQWRNDGLFTVYDPYITNVLLLKDLQEVEAMGLRLVFLEDVISCTRCMLF